MGTIVTAHTLVFQPTGWSSGSHAGNRRNRALEQGNPKSVVSNMGDLRCADRLYEGA